MTIYIYSLNDPDTDEIKYVGKTNDPKRRIAEHLIDRTKSYKNSWIKGLLQKNKNPNLKIIEECFESNWEERERYWIKYYKDLGYSLTNLTDGGEGVSLPGDKHPQHGKPISEERKRKMSKTLKEKYKDLEVKEKTYKNTGKYWMTEEGKKRMSGISKNNYEKRISSGGKNPMEGKFGELNPYFGKKHPEKIKKLLSEQRKEYWSKKTSEEKQAWNLKMYEARKKNRGTS